MNRQKCFPVDHSIGNESFVLGKAYKVDMTNVLFDMLSKYFGVLPSSHDICKFDRMILSNEILHAKSYQRVSKRDSTVVCYIYNGELKYGFIKQFYLHNQSNRSFYFAHIKNYNWFHKNSSSHIVAVSNDSSDDPDKLVSVTDICHKMFKVDYSESKFQYLCYLPNHYECC